MDNVRWSAVIGLAAMATSIWFMAIEHDESVAIWFAVVACFWAIISLNEN